jgi:hypothetical protein
MSDDVNDFIENEIDPKKLFMLILHGLQHCDPAQD